MLFTACRLVIVGFLLVGLGQAMNKNDAALRRNCQRFCVTLMCSEPRKTKAGRACNQRCQRGCRNIRQLVDLIGEQFSDDAKPPEPSKTLLARCNIEPNPSLPEEERTVRGTVMLSQSAYGGKTRIFVNVRGLSSDDGNMKHGFHVHEGGDLTEGCNGLGGHYNPENVNHGAPSSYVRHVGDLGNIRRDDNGNVETTIIDNKVSLQGPQSVIGRSIVIHATEDDLGKGGDDGSRKTGNAGPRLGCCVIGWEKLGSLEI